MPTDAPTTNTWDWIHATREMHAVGWFESDPVTSRELVGLAIDGGASSVIDVGGGASRLVDHLLDLHLDRLAVLDISEAALAIAQHRLADRAGEVEWIVGDAATVTDVGQVDVWHDRGAFHFLLDPAAQRRYVELAERTVRIGGTAVIATFADDGPERCSGLPVQRWEPDRLAMAFEHGFRLRTSRRYLHHTPAGVAQQFQYATLERVAADAP